MKKIIFFLMVLGSMTSCDKVDPGTILNGGVDPNQPAGDTTVVVEKVRKVLVEDYTGHTCGNCPKAASVIDTLHTLYGEKIVPIAIHAGGYAEPDNSLGYPADFRTPEGNTLDQFFGISAIGNPNGMINRLDYPANHIKAYTEWSTLVASQLAQEPEAFIEIKNTYNSSSNSVQSEVSSEFLKSLPGNYKLCMFLTEDSIIADQKDYRNIPLGIDVHVHDYKHKHMLRASFVGGAWGEDLVSSPAVAQRVVKTHSLVLNPAWNPAKCYVVCFIYNADNYQVIQAEQKLVK